MLDEFLKYAKMAEQLFNVTQGSNFDTSTFNNPYLVFKKQEQLKKAQQSIVTSVDNLLENSFIGKLNEIINETRNALATVLTSDKQNVRTVIEKTLTPYTNLPDREFVKLAQRAVNDLFDWAVQTDRRINTNLANILVNKEDSVSTARRILEFKEEVVGNKEHVLYRNHVINLIDAKLSDVEGGIDNISIKNKDNKAYDQNQMIYAFREIKEYLNGSDNNLYAALVRLAIVQSGLSNSPISFTSLLPYDDFKAEYGETMATIEEKENLSDYHALAVFQRNNWADDDVTPYRKAKRTESGSYNNNMKLAPKVNLAVIQGKIPKMLKLDTRAREANKDVIVYQWQDQNLTPAEQKIRDEKKARGDYSYINKGLFQKVYTDEAKTEALTIKDFYGNTQYVYKMINAWGDSFKVNEFYEVARPSAFTENGFLPVQYSVEETPNGLTYTSNEVSDATIVPYFVSPKTEEVAPEEEVVVANDNVSSNKINIYAGAGENSELSNFAFRPFEDSAFGVKYNTVEGAFQAAKLEYSNFYYLPNMGGPRDSYFKMQEKLAEATGAEAKALGRQIKGLDTKAWDSNSSKIMKDLIKDSFEQNPTALAKLLATGNAELTHTQDTTKWGKEFPRLLMEVRDELRPSPVAEKSNKKVVSSQLSLFNDAEVDAVINKKEKESERCNAK
jgi:predicted NAD-dependent protein-ADP-ribosyltransferase YbiA (DUF1768 family)